MALTRSSQTFTVVTAQCGASGKRATRTAPVNLGSARSFKQERERERERRERERRGREREKRERERDERASVTAPVDIVACAFFLCFFKA